MVPRDIENISPKDPQQGDSTRESKSSDSSQASKATVAPTKHKSKKDVTINYPRPIALSKVIEETAQWSEFSFIMDPALDCEIQIFAPHPLNREKAFGLVMAAIESVGLRMIELEEKIIKIVAASPSSFEV